MSLHLLNLHLSSRTVSSNKELLLINLSSICHQSVRHHSLMQKSVTGACICSLKCLRSSIPLITMLLTLLFNPFYPILQLLSHTNSKTQYYCNTIWYSCVLLEAVSLLKRNRVKGEQTDDEAYDIVGGRFWYFTITTSFLRTAVEKRHWLYLKVVYSARREHFRRHIQKLEAPVCLWHDNSTHNP